MKVCHVIPHYYTLYADQYEYTQILADLGVEVDSVAFGKEDEPNHERVNGVSVYRIPLSVKQRFSIRNTRTFVTETLRLLTRKRYDLVHVSSFRGCAFLPMLGKNITNHWLVDIRTGNVSSSGLRSRVADRITVVERLFFEACFVVDQNLGRKLFGSSGSFHVLPLGADFERFKPFRNQSLRRRLGIRDDEINIVYTGRLDFHRSVDRILYAFAAAQKQYARLRLLIVGDGVMLDALTSLAHHLEIVDHTTFTGSVPYVQVHEFVATADIGLAYVPITPQFDPQPPLKTVEFLAAGLPTLATRTKGNAVFIEHERNGLLVGDEPEALEKAILELATNSELRYKLARNARPSVTDYEWRKIVEKNLVPFYEELLQGR